MSKNKLVWQANDLLVHPDARLIKNNLRGIEKECLRVSQNGNISKKRHPLSLGSALTNSFITTDFGEAQLELITPPNNSIQNSLDYLNNIHYFVSQNIYEDELLWPMSMPCNIHYDSEIIVANYGESNLGKLKKTYRNGLTHRYGKKMQAISGLHYNFSISQELWSKVLPKNLSADKRKHFINENYFGLMRNIIRFGCIFPYIMGASPFILDSINSCSYKIFKNATSLRSSSFGYHNNLTTVHVSYNSVEEYIQNIRKAVLTPNKSYTVKCINPYIKKNDYQLNENILQIDNEYYSSIRPKSNLNSNDASLKNLAVGGVEYIELRGIDINPFSPNGIDLWQAAFIETFIMTCFFLESNPISWVEQNKYTENYNKVALHGKSKDCTVYFYGKNILITELLKILLEKLFSVSSWLDSCYNVKYYTKSIQHVERILYHQEPLLCDMLLDEMINSKESFVNNILSLCQKHKDYWSNFVFNEDMQNKLQQEQNKSWKKYHGLKKNDAIDFKSFLEKYYERNYISL